ncbi:hypothetical protein H0H92_002956 [Tricholoma furcatifolium]|nr:hypothetical protein H0H92_002956 [Tricholoma furcatifolium]
MDRSVPPRRPPYPVLSPARRILVAVTVDAERYTPVDLTDVLDQGAVIRTRILNKLGIKDDDEQERALIFETEFGSLHIGQPLTDQSLAALCRERGDSRASLGFIVDRIPPPPPRPTVLHTPPNSADLDDLARQQRQRNRAHTINEQIPSDGNRSDGFRSPPRRTTRPVDLPIDNTTSPGGTDEPQPRRVRPLPAIPTPASTPNSGASTSGDSFHKFYESNNDTHHDLYDPVRRLKILHSSPPRSKEQSPKAIDNPSERPVISECILLPYIPKLRGTSVRIHLSPAAATEKRKDITKLSLNPPRFNSLAVQARPSLPAAVRFGIEFPPDT